MLGKGKKMSGKRERESIDMIVEDAGRIEIESVATVDYVIDPYAEPRAWKLHTPLGIWLGRVGAVTYHAIRLDTCSWARDEGRMQDAISRGTLVEHDYIGDGVWILRTAIVVAQPWPHPLPTKGS